MRAIVTSRAHAVMLLVCLLSACSLGNPERERCATSAECQAVFGVGFYCEVSDGTCASAVTATCPEIFPADAASDPSALLFGTIFDRSSPNQLAREKAARLFVSAINTRSIDGRQVALLHCDTSATEAVEAARFLSRVDVPAIIGPSSSSDVETVFTAIRDDEVLVISPSATATQLGRIDSREPGLLWRTAPPDTLQAAVIMARLSMTPSLELSIIARQNDTYAQSLSVLLQGEVDAAGATLLATPQFADATQIQRAAADAVVGDPDVVVFISSEVSDAATFLDEAAMLPAYDLTDLFLTDAAANEDLFTLTGGGSARFDQVTATRPSAPNTIATREFNEAFASTFGDNPNPFSFVAHAYDATALVVFGASYALDASGVVTGPGIAEGITRMSMPGAETPILASNFLMIIETLRSAGTLNVVGASGPLDYDPSTEELTTASYDLLTIAAPGRFEIIPP